MEAGYRTLHAGTDQGLGVLGGVPLGMVGGGVGVVGWFGFAHRYAVTARVDAQLRGVCPGMVNAPAGRWSYRIRCWCVLHGHGNWSGFG